MNSTRIKFALPALLLLLVGPRAAAGQLAVVVNTANPILGLEAKDLERYFLGKTTVFADGVPVQLGLQETLSAEFYEKALNLSPNYIRRHWIKTVFAGNRAKPPVPLDSAAAVLDFVVANPGALAVIRLEDADPSVKVLAIDGRQPGQAGYVLAADS